MVPVDRPRDRSVCLDLIRGLAALEVAAAHLRGFMFEGADTGSSALWKAFILLTAQGHNAVIVFFVLSGYLVGRHVSERFERDGWSWTAYAVKRLTRLWIVLIPALGLTAALDCAGENLFGGSLYRGLLSPAAYGNSVPSAGEMAANHSASTFLGNLLFVQNGIRVAAYGVNGPLWSLANEFWYYVVFPLAYCAVRSRASAGHRWSCGGVFAAICIALPAHVLVYGLTWLLGFLAVALEPWRDRVLGRRARAVASVATGAVLLSSFYVVPRFADLPEIGSDFVTALLFSTTLVLIPHRDTGDGPLTRAASALSDMSYTLYLTHFPFMALVLCALDDNRKFAPDAASLSLYASLLALSVGYARVVYLLFERHTGRLQARILRLAHGR